MPPTDQQVAFICANVHEVAIQKQEREQIFSYIFFSHLDNVVHKVSPHVTKVVESLLGNLPIIRIAGKKSKIS